MNRQWFDNKVEAEYVFSLLQVVKRLGLIDYVPGTATSTGASSVLLALSQLVG